ncbi:MULTISPECIES: pyridoxal-phosphate dependent enzyme [Tenacibaculum]|uniref:pyridoxal-phosphate dependent enzyme n=1 Tax=Tenacibaculum TaxID=104267 RepID=UPI000899228A|nr:MULTISPECIES: pyridoxal-phosphate dependent enzyme [unclassified Tenacibaculum]SEE09174.1 L-threonine ammonia-lyase [Tenacibaculum sp. MAR_2010_89]
MVHKKDIEIAYKNIKDDILKTPLVHSPKLSAISGANVYLKMEHLQITDSFKIRGVLTKLKSINKKDFNKTFVAASTGNHAAAFGYASDKFGFKGKLFLPKNIREEKLTGISKYAFETVLYGNSSMETERKAREYAKEIDGVLIHPYNDPEIIKGQGTIAIEIAEQFPEVDTVIVPIGGGGLISGICSYFSENKNVTIVGSQPINASEMEQSIKINKIVSPSKYSTIADAAAGGIEENSLTFIICKKHLSHVETIKEEDIKKAVAFLYKFHETTVEPTAALPVAALLNGDKYRNKNVVVVLTGKKINKQLLTEINKNYGDCY